MSFPKLLALIAIMLFVVIGIAALLKGGKNRANKLALCRLHHWK